MNNQTVPYLQEISDSERTVFYKKTYLHLAGALLAFAILESVLLKVVPASFIEAMLGGRIIWLFIIGAFWMISYLATNFAHSVDQNKQYLGLGLYVIIEAIIFLPLMYMALALNEGNPNTIYQAATITGFLFFGLTAVAFMSGKDFSFLRNAITIGGFVALGLIVAGALFGFNLGLWFSVGMACLAGASILYQTSNLIRDYESNQYVGAALCLFSSFMLLFWYILRIFSSRD